MIRHNQIRLIENFNPVFTKYTLAIGNVVQRGALIYIYDENNRQINSVPAGNGSNDGLKGYTSTRINVQRGAIIYSYNEHGQQVGCVPAR